MIRDLRDFSNQIQKDTKAVFNRTVVKDDVISCDDLSFLDHSVREQALLIINDNRVYLTDPQSKRARDDYLDFEVDHSLVMKLLEVPVVREKLDLLVPQFVPTEAIFWKRLLYQLDGLRGGPIEEDEDVNWDD